MVKYVLKRLAFMLLTFFVLLTICFISIKLIEPPRPVDPKELASQLAFRDAMGYNKPLIVQYFIYMKSILTKFDWGYSFQLYPLAKINDIIISKLPPTIMINVYALIISLPIGVALGTYAALRKNKWQDHLISTIVMVFISVPSFIYAFIVQYIFAFKLDIFPPLMFSLSDAGDSWFSFMMFRSMILPIFALSFGTIATFTRQIRSELSEVLTSEFMLLARSKGLSKTQATVRHAFKNSMVPIMPSIIGSFVSILGGSLVIERIFSIPGIGTLMIRSIEQLDYNVFLGVGAFYTFIGLLTGIVVDISYGFIDPRIRMGARK